MQMTDYEIFLSFTCQNSHPPSLYPDAPLGDELDSLGIGLAFRFKYPRGKRVGRIVVQHGDSPLQDHGAVVVLVVGKVDRAAAELGPIIDHGLMHVMAVE